MKKFLLCIVASCSIITAVISQDPQDPPLKNPWEVDFSNPFVKKINEDDLREIVTNGDRYSYGIHLLKFNNLSSEYEKSVYLSNGIKNKYLQNQRNDSITTTLTLLKILQNYPQKHISAAASTASSIYDIFKENKNEYKKIRETLTSSINEEYNELINKLASNAFNQYLYDKGISGVYQNPFEAIKQDEFLDYANDYIEQYANDIGLTNEQARSMFTMLFFDKINTLDVQANKSSNFNITDKSKQELAETFNQLANKKILDDIIINSQIEKIKKENDKIKAILAEIQKEEKEKEEKKSLENQIQEIENIQSITSNATYILSIFAPTYEKELKILSQTTNIIANVAINISKLKTLSTLSTLGKIACYTNIATAFFSLISMFESNQQESQQAIILESIQTLSTQINQISGQIEEIKQLMGEQFAIQIKKFGELNIKIDELKGHILDIQKTVTLNNKILQKLDKKIDSMYLINRKKFIIDTLNDYDHYYNNLFKNPYCKKENTCSSLLIEQTKKEIFNARVFYKNFIDIDIFNTFLTGEGKNVEDVAKNFKDISYHYFINDLAYSTSFSNQLVNPIIWNMVIDDLINIGKEYPHLSKYSSELNIQNLTESTQNIFNQYKIFKLFIKTIKEQKTIEKYLNTYNDQVNEIFNLIDRRCDEIAGIKEKMIIIETFFDIIKNNKDYNPHLTDSQLTNYYYQIQDLKKNDAYINHAHTVHALHSQLKSELYNLKIVVPFNKELSENLYDINNTKIDDHPKSGTGYSITSSDSYNWITIKNSDPPYTNHVKPPSTVCRLYSDKHPIDPSDPDYSDYSYGSYYIDKSLFDHVLYNPTVHELSLYIYSNPRIQYIDYIKEKYEEKYHLEIFKLIPDDLLTIIGLKMIENSSYQIFNIGKFNKKNLELMCLANENKEELVYVMGKGHEKKHVSHIYSILLNFFDIKNYNIIEISFNDNILGNIKLNLGIHEQTWLKNENKKT